MKEDNEKSETRLQSDIHEMSTSPSSSLQQEGHSETSISENEVGDDHQTSKESRLSREIQDRFVSFIFPYISRGKQLCEEDLRLICSEAERIGLPLEVLDRLFEDHCEHYKQQKQEANSLTTYKKKLREAMEEVDESDNIQAYFSRMASLKEGGHLPKLNTEAFESFVENDTSVKSDEVEIDLDVGYINRSLDLSLDQSSIDTHGSLDDFEPFHDIQTAFEGGLRYESAEKDQRDEVTESLTAETSSSRRVTFALDSDEEQDSYKKDKERTESNNNKEEEKKEETERKKRPSSHSSRSRDGSYPKYRNDWTVCSRKRNMWHYGYGKELDEWKLKRDMALWQSQPKKKNIALSRATSCHSGGDPSCVDKHCVSGFSLLRPPPPLTGQGAVQDMIAKAQRRARQRQKRNQRRRVPENFATAPRPWQMKYKERCRAHSGHIGVDQYSLLAAISQSPDPRDGVPWESRDVRQHFLHDQSLAFSRNWFGELRKKKGNDPVQYHPCRPKSMEMPTEDDPPFGARDDWTDYGGGYHKSGALRKAFTKITKINRTASLSFSSAEDHQDDESAHFARSVHSQSVMTPSLNEYSTGFNSDDVSHHEDAASDSHSALMVGETDDVPSFGMDSDAVSAIVDVEDSNTSSISKKHSRIPTYKMHYKYGGHGSLDLLGDDGGGSEILSRECDSYYDDDEDDWEDVPECGTLINVKPKINERVSRLTPDHTSHLLRSRFRKKYFPRGTFPYG